ncbi:SDR family oxidoreductase [Loktanella sp. SALINAS62]|nr:SDR family NAD(P)-dependent oxidoreductase [Loktanella sp. SALINAS62]MBS1302665.1 SDR family oxidoreductase [Loktanella sp. SALINAS62]
MTGQVAIISGASRGIGRAVAVRLAQAGADLVLGASRDGALDDTLAAVQATGRDAVAIFGDISDPDVSARMATAAMDRFGRIDIAVCNAGMNQRISTLDLALDDWQRMLDVNLNGTLHLCRAVLPHMMAARTGRIVSVSSSASKAPHPNASPAYGASKAAVNYLVMHFAREFALHGIRVNAVCPGPIQTDMTDQWDIAYRAQVLAKVPMGRLGSDTEIADTVLFLASPASGFITGATLNANGGTLMG